VDATANGGATPKHYISAASTNPTSVKASAGQLYSLVAFNQNGAQRFVKFYDKASAPTVGTDVPVWTVGLPGNATGAGSNIAVPQGLQFVNGIAFAITGLMPDADTTAVAANDVALNLAYI
jgi:hypothetical protein